jgi:hypothetical protein
MSEPTSGNPTPHFMQTLLDNQWIMLLLGLVVPTVIYTLWGLWDVMRIPLAP